MSLIIERRGHPWLEDRPLAMKRIMPRSDDLHSHDFFELVYVTRGTAVHHLGMEEMPLKAGDFFIIDTGSAHCYQNNQNFEIVNCLFYPEYIDRSLVNCHNLAALLSNQVLRFGVPVDLHTADRIFQDEDGMVRTIIESMEKEYREQQLGYMELLRGRLMEVLIRAVRLSERAEKRRTPHPATISMVEYVRRNYQNPLSLADLSQQLGYSPQYLSGLFHRDTGVSLQEYLQRYRVEMACQLMEERKLSIGELAQQVGYGDAKHFSAIFRRYKGMSPKARSMEKQKMGQ